MHDPSLLRYALIKFLWQRQAFLSQGRLIDNECAIGCSRANVISCCTRDIPEITDSMGGNVHDLLI